MNKDIKYILKRVIIGVLIAIFLFSIKSCNVHATTYVQPNVGLQINNNTNYQYSVTNSTTGTSYNIKVAASEITPAYFILDTCVSANYTDFEITNSSCDNSCINNGKVLYYTIGNLGDCKINGYNGRHVLLQLQVRKYEIDPVTTYYIANSRIRFGGYSNYTSVVRIDNFYATDEDVLTQLANGQLQYNDIKNSINSVNNSINNQTNTIINNQNNNTKDITDAQQDTTDAINDLNDTMSDSSTDSPNNGINAVKNGIATNGVITQLITLPVTLFQQILTSINGTCQSFNLGSLFGTDLILPCINVSDYLGSTLWGVIDVIISGYFVWVISRKMISAFDMFSTMKDGDVLDD